MPASLIAIDRNDEGRLLEGARAFIAELKDAKEHGLPFIVEWRQSAKIEHPYAGDAGCGCGPAD
jgi:hypothetical protein